MVVAIVVVAVIMFGCGETDGGCVPAKTIVECVCVLVCLDYFI